jgi:preprotein translocase subunit SecE
MNILNFFQKIPEFLSEVKTEMKKVSWPTRQQALRNTAIVIGATVATAILLGGLDALFTWIINKVI